MIENDQNSQKKHYSEKGGHFERGKHDKTTSLLGGNPPETLPGFTGMTNGNDAWMKKRQMRRIRKDGRR